MICNYGVLDQFNMALSLNYESVEIKAMILETLDENADKLLSLFNQSEHSEIVSSNSYSRTQIEHSLKSIDSNVISDLMMHTDQDIKKLSRKIWYKLIESMSQSQEMDSMGYTD